MYKRYKEICYSFLNIRTTARQHYFSTLHSWVQVISQLHTEPTGISSCLWVSGPTALAPVNAGQPITVAFWEGAHGGTKRGWRVRKGCLSSVELVICHSGKGAPALEKEAKVCGKWSPRAAPLTILILSATQLLVLWKLAEWGICHSVRQRYQEGTIARVTLNSKYSYNMLASQEIM